MYRRVFSEIPVFHSLDVSSVFSLDSEMFLVIDLRSLVARLERVGNHP